MKIIMKRLAIYCLALGGACALTNNLSAMESLLEKGLKAAADKAATVNWSEVADTAARKAAEIAQTLNGKVKEYADEQEEKIVLTTQQEIEACERAINNQYSTETEKSEARARIAELKQKRDADIAELRTDTVKTTLAAGKAELDKRAAARERQEKEGGAERAAEPANDEKPAEKKKAFELPFELPGALVLLQEIPWADLPWGDLFKDLSKGIGKAAAGTFDAANKVADMTAEKISEANKAQKDCIEKEFRTQLAECFKVINNESASVEEKAAAEQRVTSVTAKRDEALALLERDIATIRTSVLATAVKLRNQLLVLDSIVELSSQKLNKEETENPLIKEEAVKPSSANNNNDNSNNDNNAK